MTEESRMCKTCCGTGEVCHHCGKNPAEHNKFFCDDPAWAKCTDSIFCNDGIVDDDPFGEFEGWHIDSNGNYVDDNKEYIAWAKKK